MPGTDFEISWIDGVPVVSAPAEIDVTNAAQLGDALRSCADAGNGSLVVDMSTTTFCDSAGVEQLVRAHRRAEAVDGEVRLVIGVVTVMRILAIIGVDRIMPVFTSLDDALAETSASNDPA
jgi:anti-sigma B factor antagonist